MGFKLLIYALTTLPSPSGRILAHRDNTRVVEGWWKNHHQNTEVNIVFRQIHKFIHNLPHHFKVVTTYITSKSNPADKPSRGIYGPAKLPLPVIPIPADISPFIIDATEPLSPAEIRHLRKGNYSTPATKLINHTLVRQQAAERAAAEQFKEDTLINNALCDE